MVRHQAIRKDLIVAFTPVFAQHRQELVAVLLIFKDPLLVDAAVDYVIDSERTGFSWSCRHDSPFLKCGSICG